MPIQPNLSCASHYRFKNLTPTPLLLLAVSCAQQMKSGFRFLKTARLNYVGWLGRNQNQGPEPQSDGAGSSFDLRPMTSGGGREPAAAERVIFPALPFGHALALEHRERIQTTR